MPIVLMAQLLTPILGNNAQQQFVHNKWASNQSLLTFLKLKVSGVTIGRARRAVHAGPALWGAQNLPDAVFKVFLGEEGALLWNTCTRAHCNLVTPLLGG